MHRVDRKCLIGSGKRRDKVATRSTDRGELQPEIDIPAIFSGRGFEELPRTSKIPALGSAVCLFTQLG
jgi:hypothetical protein